MLTWHIRIDKFDKVMGAGKYMETHEHVASPLARQFLLVAQIPWNLSHTRT
jgi:hypothetical protein